MPEYETRKLAGWTLHIRRELLRDSGKEMVHAVSLLQGQLETIHRCVPEPARKFLQTVVLWMSPTYPSTVPRAEYHPGVEWLRENKRDPDMVRGVEFSVSKGEIVTLIGPNGSGKSTSAKMAIAAE